MCVCVRRGMYITITITICTCTCTLPACKHAHTIILIGVVKSADHNNIIRSYLITFQKRNTEAETAHDC